MKYLKLYEGFQSEEEVSKICKEFGIKNWSINSDGLVDVNGNVDLDDKGLTKIPLKFGYVSGYFLCSDNQLTSLEGSPERVGGNFDCDNNQLTSLEGCPRSVGRNFNCFSNQLTSLEGPRYIEGKFYCSDNPMENVWKIISPDGKWDNSIMDLFNDYDALRGNEIVLDRFNEFLEEIGRPTVKNVDGYNNI